jgi:hypothetical protein
VRACVSQITESKERGGTVGKGRKGRNGRRRKGKERKGESNLLQIPSLLERTAFGALCTGMGRSQRGTNLTSASGRGPQRCSPGSGVRPPVRGGSRRGQVINAKCVAVKLRGLKSCPPNGFQARVQPRGFGLRQTAPFHTADGPIVRYTSDDSHKRWPGGNVWRSHDDNMK